MDPLATTRAKATLYAVLFGAVGMGLGAVATALFSREIPGGADRSSAASLAPLGADAAPAPAAKGDGLVVGRK